MQDRIRTRLMTAGGTMLAVGGLAVASLAASPALAQDDAGVEANAEVANVIELSADDPSFTLNEVPGATASSSSNLTAKSNNLAGYNVAVQAEGAELAGTGENTDVIPVSALEVEASEGFASVSQTEGVTVHHQAEKSASEGDSITANYQMAMPFVNADTYSVGLTFTATAN